MGYSIPHYINTASFGDAFLSFRWDDWRASQDFRYDPSKVVERVAQASWGARIALGIGVYEWIIWRFGAALNDRTPYQVAEASWCATVSTTYMNYDEFDRREWLGPVKGPMWCAMTWLMPMVLFSADNPDEWESGMSYLTSLAVHVLTNPHFFEDWLDKSIDRLNLLYPVSREDPFQSLFAEGQQEQSHVLVPSQALDFESEFNPEETMSLVDGFLRSVNYSSNPFLKSPETLLYEGFVGRPYRLIDGS